MINKVRKILYNNKEYVWALIGRFLPQAFSLLTTIILSRLLTPSDFGMVGVLSVFMYIAGVLLDSGLGGSLVKEKDIEKIDCSTIFSFNLFVSIFLYLLMFVSAPYIESFYCIDGLCGVTRSLSLIFIINALGIVPNSLLIKQLKFKEISHSLVLSTVIASLVAIIVAFYQRSVYAIVVLQLSQSIVLVILYHYYCHYSFSLRFSFSSFKKLLPFGLSTTISSVFDTIYENIISAILGKFSGATIVGYFSQAKRIEEVPSKSIVQTISNTSFPMLVKFVDDTIRMNTESMRIFRFSSLLFLPVFGVLICFPDIIIRVLLGAQWVDASSFLQLLSYAGIFLFIDTMYKGFIKSANKPSLLLRSTFLKRAIGITIILLVALGSSEYILYAYILSSVVAALISVKYYTSIIKVPFLRYICKMSQVIMLASIPLSLILLCGYFFEPVYIKAILSVLILGVYYTVVISQKRVH